MRERLQTIKYSTSTSARTQTGFQPESCSGMMSWLALIHAQQPSSPNVPVIPKRQTSASLVLPTCQLSGRQFLYIIQAQFVQTFFEILQTERWTDYHYVPVQGAPRHNVTWRSMARHVAKHYMAFHDTTLHGAPWHNVTWRSVAQHYVALRGTTLHGAPWHNITWHPVAQH